MHSRTTPYHPRGNGLVERMNRTLLNMPRTLPGTRKSSWKDHVNKLIHAYNYTVHESTGYSPFFLLFGRSPRLPIDAIFDPQPETGARSHAEYVTKWKTAMQEAYSLALKSAAKSAIRGKRELRQTSEIFSTASGRSCPSLQPHPSQWTWKTLCLLGRWDSGGDCKKRWGKPCVWREIRIRPETESYLTSKPVTSLWPSSV